MILFGRFNCAKMILINESFRRQEGWKTLAMTKGVISAEFHTQLNFLSEPVKIELWNRKTRQKGAQTLQLIDVIY